MVLFFDIKRYAIHDGPGIRTTLFMKGCPLRCVWCHNPESWSALPQKLYKSSKCIGCATCVEVCPQQAISLTPDGIRPTGNACIRCGRCTEECPTTALEMCGREWTLDSLMAEVEKERAVMEESGGGVTLCGGEPLMHADEALAILTELGRRGFHRVVDTTLYASASTVSQVASECELFLVDLKLMDAAKHHRYTGVSNEPILRNIEWLAAHDIDFLVRIPLIEGVNADEENIEATAAFLESLPWRRRTVELLPYHDIGKDKHTRMWSRYNPDGYIMNVPTEDTIKRCTQQFEAHGIQVVES